MTGMPSARWVWLVLALAARLPAAEAPVLGTRPTGIVNDEGQVVGSGPPLSLVGATPKEDPRERYLAAVEWLRTFLTSLNTLERDLVAIKMALRTGAVELKELRDAMRSLRATREKAYTDGLREQCDRFLAAKDGEVFKLAAEQDALIAGALRRWQDLADGLAAKTAETAEFPEFQKALVALQKCVAQKRQLSEMELYLSAGRRTEFDRLAHVAEQEPALQMPVLLMRCADYLEAGEGRLALFAARLGAERYPQNPAFQAMGQGLDVSYLRAISAKAMGDGAEIHRLWDSYGNEVSDSVIKQFFAGSLRHTSDLATGRAWDLELVHKDAMVRATAEHNGLEVMWRLREKGLTFDEIRALSPEQMQARLGLTNPLSNESVTMLHTSLQAAFENPDVRRLLTRTKEQFDLDTGKSYYGAEEFDTGLLEYALDAVNVKNVLLFLGPGAVVKYGQAEAGLLTRLSRLGVAEGEVAKSFEGAVTVRDWLLARPSMQQAFGYLSKTRAGQGLGETMETLRVLRYESGAFVKVGMAVAELGAQFMVFEAGGKIGQALGGDFGEFVGQALAMLIGNPLADLQAKETKALQQTAREMAARRVKWEAQNAVLREIRLPVRKAVDRVVAGGALTPAEVAELDQAAARAATVANEARAGGSALEQTAADEAEAIGNAANAAKRGEAAGAATADDIARQLEERGQAGAEEARKAEQAIDDAARTARPGPPPPEPLPESLSTRLVPGETPKPTPPAPPPPKPEPTGKTPRECVELGEKAMQEGRYADAQRHYRAGLELDRMDKRLDPDEVAFWSSRIREARHAETYAANVAKRAENAALAAEIDQATQPFGKTMIEDLQNPQKVVSEAITGTTGGPRKVGFRGADGKIGETVGIWKPSAVPGGRNMGQMNDDGQLVAEVLYCRLARRLGLRVPHAERLVLPVPDAKGNLVPTEGVIIRYIPHSREMQGMSKGMVAVLKEQMAKFRVLQVLTGNYDIHLSNWRVDAAGRVWSIDGGMATLESGIPQGFSFDDVARCFRTEFGVGKGPIRSGHDALDLTRLWRDAYRNHWSNGETLRRLDDWILGRDLAGVAQEAKRITPAEFNQFVDDVIRVQAEAQAARQAQAQLARTGKAMTPEEIAKLADDLFVNHAAAKRVKETYQLRWDNLETLLNERWPGALPGPQAEVIDLFGVPLRRAA